jgi:hypothetical protein
MDLADFQGDWWWSFLEEPSAGQRWRIDGDRVTSDGSPLTWSDVPEGVRVEQENDTFILIEPREFQTGVHVANLHIVDKGEMSYWEAGVLLPYRDAEARGWLGTT